MFSLLNLDMLVDRFAHQSGCREYIGEFREVGRKNESEGWHASQSLRCRGIGY